MLIKNVITFFFLPIIILNPYTVIGPLGSVIFCILMAFMVFLSGSFKIRGSLFYTVFIMFFIGVLAALNTTVRGVPAFSYITFSLFVLLLVTMGSLLKECFSFELDEVIKSVVFAAVANGIIIIFQVFSLDFRQLIESFLVAAGNRDWSEGFRYRGIASSGGAALSVLYAIATHSCYYLYKEKKINTVLFLFSLTILLFSVFFIGRTGMILSFFVISCWLIFSGGAFKKVLAKSLVLISVLSTILLFEYYAEDIFGRGFYQYSLGFLSNAEDIENEASFNAILDFWSIFPSQFPEVLIGYGHYVNNDLPAMDPGYNRTFVSLGYPLAVVFYFAFLRLFIGLDNNALRYLVPVLILLLIAELKEPMLFSGYGSRVLLIFVGYSLSIKKLSNRDKIDT